MFPGISQQTLREGIAQWYSTCLAYARSWVQSLVSSLKFKQTNKQTLLLAPFQKKEQTLELYFPEQWKSPWSNTPITFCFKEGSVCSLVFLATWVSNAHSIMKGFAIREGSSFYCICVWIFGISLVPHRSIVDRLTNKEDTLLTEDWAKLTWLKEGHLLGRHLMPRESSLLFYLGYQGIESYFYFLCWSSNVFSHSIY